MGATPVLGMRDTLGEFATAPSTQGQAHIRPVHFWVAARLAIEGGFRPEEITPRPPFRSVRRRGKSLLLSAPEAATRSELTIVGGLKSKTVDVAVCKEGVGPVLCVSIKGTCNAFRNLTNRMEEAIGDCTNVHLMYPGVVFGFLHLLRENAEGQAGIAGDDICLRATGEPVVSVVRYHQLLADLAGRKFIRNAVSSYEVIGLMVVGTSPSRLGELLDCFPPPDSPVHWRGFFDRLYEVYDLRYPFRNPSVRGLERVVWDADSPAFGDLREALGDEWQCALGYEPRTRRP